MGPYVQSAAHSGGGGRLLRSRWRNAPHVNNNPINFTDPSGHCSDDPNVDDDECWKMYAKVVNVLGGARNQRITRDPRALAVLKAMDKYDLQSLLGMIRMRKPYPLSQSVSTNYDTRLWLVAFFGGLQSMENSGGKIDAVEAMARWVEFTVALHSGMGLGSNQVMDDLLLIENGLKKNGWGGIYDVPEVFQEMGPGWFNDSGFASIFQDNDDQVFHAMLSIAVGSDFPLGPFVAEGVNIFHETVDLGACRTHNNCLYGKSVQDLLLSQRAIAVGVAMNRSSAITWGDWIRLGFRGGVFISPFDWPIFKDC